MALLLLMPLLHFVSGRAVGSNSTVLPPAGSLTITNVTHSAMMLSWDAAPPPVLKYTIVYKSEDGDLRELEVDGNVTATVLRLLVSQTEYDVTVTPIYARGPAAPMSKSAITDIIPAPKNLRFSEVTTTSFRVTWEQAAPDVALYRLDWAKRTDAEFTRLILKSDETSMVLNDLEPLTQYFVSVTAIFPDENESDDLFGKEITNDQCKTSGKADIVLLVDESGSIGIVNFNTICLFIAQMVGAFDIGPERVQIGLVQFSDDPRTVWSLNSHQTRSSLLQAMPNLQYRGGSTSAGSALNHTFHHNLCPVEGLRDDAQQILVFITDGDSEDDVAAVSRKLRDSGVELFAIGVSDADRSELRSIASGPEEIHVHSTGEFSSLQDIQVNFTANLCNSVKGAGPVVKADLVPPLPSVSSRLAFQQSPQDRLSSEGVELQSRGSVLVQRGLDIIVSCFVQSHSLDGHFLLQTPLGNHTLPADNHAAHFLIYAFSSAHSGPYTCVYLPQVPCRILTFCGPALHLKVGDLNRDLLIRAVVVLFSLVSTSLLQFYYYFYCYKPPGPGPGPD